mgnify:CR=1 FL=1
MKPFGRTYTQEAPKTFTQRTPQLFIYLFNILIPLLIIYLYKFYKFKVKKNEATTISTTKLKLQANESKEI